MHTVLKEDDARRIKIELVWQGEGRGTLAKRYGVQREAIREIELGHSWKKVDGTVLPVWML